MKRQYYLIVLAVLALPGCQTWQPEGIRKLAADVEKVGQSIAIVSDTLERIEIAGNDPNKYDELQQSLVTAQVITEGLHAAVQDMNQPAIDGAALENTGKAVAATVAVATPVGGAIIYGLSTLLGAWFRKDETSD